MKKYDSYKDSGIEWLKEIPKGWNLARMRYVCDISTGDKDTINKEENGNYPFYVRSKNIERISTYTYDEEAILTPGDGDICKIWHYINGKFECHQRVYKLSKFSEVTGKFLYYFLMQNFENEVFKLSAKSTVDSLRRPMFQNFPIAFGTIEEQNIITYYLDNKTSQIEHLIAKKERFIQLLEEERVAVINQALTKGLDPTVPMKDSGIEWLGEIPAHWELKRMRYLCDVTTGGKDTENREDDGEYPFFVRSQTIERISTYSFDGEAILTAGDGVGVCKVWHYVNEKFDFHQRVYMMSNFQPVLGKYLFYYLKENFGKEVMKLSAKSTVDSLRRPMFQNFMVCFGSLEEQKQIINQIEKEELRIETLITKSQQEIELLKEYKTALINEVVTGKVDVRTEKLN